MARYLVKNIVASGLCDKCEIQLSYAIGIAQSVSIFLEDFNTAKIEKNKIVDFIVNNFDLSPK
ncbi:MAG: S-adenosylmethionine synthase [candidate division CPR1 bacterium ADurb.Bin160]|jgi:S-adenosylmethionine synthetase|uniref:S-adenosylmethionine synthase n=1 Tax=candidate division CPR1 bacterium ADurb.Bin160 TaxID=1852826 RepID=A0A1V5ZPH3_9BACT|nr:MAG: S-adenosylmethionine synthase [candidate division CPR1 bacterium ADurb.Bin160]